MQLYKLYKVPIAPSPLPSNQRNPARFPRGVRALIGATLNTINLTIATPQDSLTIMTVPNVSCWHWIATLHPQVFFNFQLAIHVNRKTILAQISTTRCAAGAFVNAGMGFTKGMESARLNWARLLRKKTIAEVECSRTADVYAKTISFICRTCGRASKVR